MITAYRIGAVAGIVRQGILWAISASIGGLFLYNYILLKLPGLGIIPLPDPTSPLLSLYALMGSLIGWLVAYLSQKIRRLF
jgi:hypothetical protein